MKEKDTERKMSNIIRRCGGRFYKFVSPGNPGVPDRILITPAGVVWFVELKTSGGRLSKIQKWQIAELERLNANVRVLYGWEEAENFMFEVLGDGV